MKIKNNKILLIYSVNSIIASLTLIISLGFFINSYMKKNIIKSHIKYYPYIVQNIVIEDKLLMDLFLKPEKIDINDIEALKFFKINSSVFRVKIWDKYSKVIWSDNKEIIGEQFLENKKYDKAMSGFPTYEIKPDKKDENVGEIGNGDIFEFYIPVYFQGEIIGIVELYEDNSLLTKDLEYSNNTIWAIIIINIFIFYFLRLSIYLYADRRHNKIYESLKQTQEVTIFALAYQAELRDSNTGYHLMRTSNYAGIIAEKLKGKIQDQFFLKGYEVHDIENAAILHDIGKVGISDAILNKPGKLTFEEFQEVKKHCEYGYKTLSTAEEKLGSNNFLNLALEIVLFHHEKWDGSGYPQGLSEEEIPLPARIMALSDVYDALRSERPYKVGFSHEKALEIIKSERGKHFDPMIVDIFLEHNLEFERISNELLDL